MRRDLMILVTCAMLLYGCSGSRMDTIPVAPQSVGSSDSAPPQESAVSQLTISPLSELPITIDAICNLANAVNPCADVALCTGTEECSKTVFVTSTTQHGDLGGLSRADALCQDLADSAGLSGPYHAWRADANPGNVPNIRFNQATMPYTLTEFTDVDADWTHLTCWPSYRTD